MSFARAWVIDDHPLVLEGVCALLRRARFSAVEAASSVADAFELLRGGTAPDLAVVDYLLGDGAIVEVIAQLHDLSVPTILFTGHLSGAVVQTALDAGATGIVGKGTPPRLLLEAIEAAMIGKTFLCPRAQDLLADDHAPHLSSRELQVLELIARGLSTKEIATRFGVATRTVKTHRERLHAKLDAHNATDLTREAVRRKLIRTE
jgi:DNA-binding NarL/FixJ family response regulator